MTPEEIKRMNPFKAYIYKFCAIYGCTIEDICKVTGFQKGNFRRSMDSRNITLNSYFRLCEGLCKLSLQYNEEYYLTRIKHALLQKDLRDDQSFS